MTPERWNQIEVVFSAAVDKDPHERQAYLDETCAHDAGLRADVDNLLAEDEKAAKKNFLAETVSWAATSTEPDKDMIGRRIGAYEIKQLLGRGGMGKVYLAVDDELNIRVAIKIVRPGMDTDEVLRQFNRERRLHAAG